MFQAKTRGIAKEVIRQSAACLTSCLILATSWQGFPLLATMILISNETNVHIAIYVKMGESQG